MAKKRVVAKKTKTARVQKRDSVLFSVTPVSKGIAFALFIVFPLIAFALGGQYFQKTSMLDKQQELMEPNYVCPAVQRVNCVQPVLAENQKMCNSQYLDWAKENCPSFEGALY